MRNIHRLCLGLVLAPWLALGIACAGAPKTLGPEASWRPNGAADVLDQPYRDYTIKSFYLKMRDGVRIAVDLYLPQGRKPDDKLPTLLMQTRYFRSWELYWPTSAIVGVPEELQRVVRHGYALVRTDVRGTGASFGSMPSPWSPEMVRDGAEIVDWIVAQPWSNGKVGAAGGSYEGTTAEFVAVAQHPAVKAIVPAFALFDVYADIAFPGGVQLSWFTRVWGQSNLALDADRIDRLAWWSIFFTRGVNPVDGDYQRKLLQQAVAQHRGNIDVYREAQKITYRDDETADGFGVDRFSPHTFVDKEAGAHVAILNFSGWFDGGYPHAAVKRFLTIHGPQDKLVLGPWDHGGGHRVRPFGPTVDAQFDLVREVIRFMDYHLKGFDTGIYREPPVRFYEMGAEQWQAAATWPPADVKPTTFYLAENRGLAATAPTAAGEDVYNVDLTAKTGDRARWNGLADSTDTGYPDRREQDEKLLTYETAPLTAPLEIAGHPIVTLFVAASRRDGEFFAYLEDIDDNGRIAYVTEGVLRALHRKVSSEKPPYVSPTPYHSFLRKDGEQLTPNEPAEIVFDLQPVAYMFAAGHRIRLALAGADASHFAILPGLPPTWRVQRAPNMASRLVLPAR